MKRSYWYALAALIILSILVRTYPLFSHSLWGMDAGEYVYYTKQWIVSGSMHRSIDGWAGAYPFFPGLFSLSGSFHLLTGIGVYESVSFTPVILSSLVPLIVFLLVYRISLHKTASLLSAAFLTFIVPFVYSHSQPKPETLGFFLMVFILWMTFTVSKENFKRFLPLLVLFSAALIITHHLSSFFLIIFLLGGYFFSELLRTRTLWENKFRGWFYLGFTTATLLYWSFGAPVFRDQRLLGTLGFPSYSIVLAPYAVIIFAYLIINLRRKISWKPEVDLSGDELSEKAIFSVILSAIIIGILVYSSFVNIPGTDIVLETDILLYSPLLLFGIFALFSSALLLNLREGTSVLGWILAACFTFILGVITGSSSLYTIRQVAFFMLPLAVLFGIGTIWFHNLTDPFSKRTKVLALCIIILLAWNVPLMYPSQETAGGYVEWTDHDAIEASYWARYSVNDNILTDHRLSGAIFSTGKLNVSWTEGEPAYFSDSVQEAEETISHLDVKYIMMDRCMIKGAAVTEGTNPEPVNPVLLKWYRSGYAVYRGENTELYLIPLGG
ncbi:MAG: hypothetical protein R6U17_06435 [Thermoplasmata archaeon]